MKLGMLDNNIYPFDKLIESIKAGWDPDHPMEAFHDNGTPTPFYLYRKDGELYLINSKHRMMVLLFLGIEEVEAFVGGHE